MRETVEQVVVLGRESSFFSAPVAPPADLAALRGMVTARPAPADRAASRMGWVMCHSEIDGLRIQLVSPEFSAGTFDASFCHSMGLV